MNVSAWLIIELRNRGYHKDRFEPVITKVRQSRPTNDLAVKVTLDIDPDQLQPHVEAMVDAGLIFLEIEEPEPEEVEENESRKASGEDMVPELPPHAR